MRYLSFRTYVFAGIVGLATLAVLWAYFSSLGRSSEQAFVTELRPDDVAFVAMGQAIYSENCAACHGSNLEGQANWRQRNPNGRLPAPPHNETGHTWHHPDAALFQLTKYGPAALVGGGYVSDMPGYEGVLTDEEILAVLSYIKSRWPDAVRDQHDGVNARGGHR